LLLLSWVEILACSVLLSLPSERLKGKAPEIQAFVAGKCSYNKV
jgi:hypothetical protein